MHLPPIPWFDGGNTNELVNFKGKTPPAYESPQRHSVVNSAPPPSLSYSCNHTQRSVTAAMAMNNSHLLRPNTAQRKGTKQKRVPRAGVWRNPLRQCRHALQCCQTVPTGVRSSTRPVEVCRASSTSVVSQPARRVCPLRDTFTAAVLWR